MALRITNWICLCIYGIAAIRIHFGVSELSPTVIACMWSVLTLILGAHASALASLYLPNSPFSGAALVLNFGIGALLAFAALASAFIGQFGTLIIVVPLITVYYFNTRLARQATHKILKTPRNAAP